MRQRPGGQSCRCPRVQCEDTSEGEHQDEPRGADHQREHDLCQSPHAQRGEEFRSRTVADRENEQAEQNRPEDRREREAPELSDQHGDDQDAGGSSDREAANPDAAEDGADRDREQQENFRCGGDDPPDGFHGIPQALRRDLIGGGGMLLDPDQAFAATWRRL
ncbi:hypothetical protein ACVWYQ_000854 [Bradyrhizobium sp. USDA 3397]